MDSRSELRDQYASTFQTAKNLYVRIHHTAPMGDTVVLHETISGVSGVEPNEQVVLCYVADGAIDRVWLVPKERLSRVPEPDRAPEKQR